MTHVLGLAAAALLLAADDDLSAAAKKSGEISSYGFKITTTGGKGKAAGGTVEGKYEKDQPVSLKGAGAEAFRKGGVLVTLEGDAWKRFERLKGAAAKAAGAKKRGNPGEILAAVKLPHEELAEIDKAIPGAKKAETPENECAVFSGDLTPEAARSFGNPGTKGGGDLTYTGTAKVWVNAQGAIAKYELTIKASGKVKEKDVEFTTTRTVELTEIGTAKVEVPEAARKALDNQS